MDWILRGLLSTIGILDLEFWKKTKKSQFSHIAIIYEAKLINKTAMLGDIWQRWEVSCILDTR